LDTRDKSVSSANFPILTLAAPVRRRPGSLRDRDDSDPARRVIELAQRGRMILDVSTADLEAAEASFGPFHATTWHFRNELNEARRSWDRLRAEFGSAALEAALNEPPFTILELGKAGGDASHRDGYRDCGHAEKRPHAGSPGSSSAPVTLIPIGGQTYRVQGIEGTALAPVQWRLTRLSPPLADGPYFACRLHDGSTQCDCADWTYQSDSNGDRALCKHLRALEALGWI
jgi:hypothetical protein